MREIYFQRNKSPLKNTRKRYISALINIRCKSTGADQWNDVVSAFWSLLNFVILPFIFNLIPLEIENQEKKRNVRDIIDETDMKGLITAVIKLIMR